MAAYNLRDIKLGLITKPPKKSAPIPKMSAKRKKENVIYRAIVKEIITDETICKIGAPGCTVNPSGAHHLQKRTPKNFIKKSNLIPACSSCNLWIETNSKQAATKGFTISRFKK